MQLPLNVSPVSASFFGFKHQGIHLVLCVACSQFCLLFFLCFNLRFHYAFSKIEGISYSVGKVRVEFVLYILQGTPTAGEWKPV